MDHSPETVQPDTVKPHSAEEQSVPVPGKRSPWPVIAGILALVIVVMGILLYRSQQAVPRSPGTTKNDTPSVAPTASDVTSTVGPSPTTGAPSTGETALPIENTVYIGRYNNAPGVFFTSARFRQVYEGGVERNDTQAGFFQETGAEGRTHYSVRFDTVTAAVPAGVLPSGEEIEIFNGTRLADDSTSGYSSVIRVQRGNANNEIVTNEVYRIDTAGTVREIWKRDITDGAFGDANGAVYPFAVAPGGGYIAAHVAACYRCGGGMVGVVVINTNTGAVRYLEDGALVSFSGAASATYQKETTVAEPCEDGPFCDGGTYQKRVPDGNPQPLELP
jgi:hypothetical protein